MRRARTSYTDIFGPKTRAVFHPRADHPAPAGRSVQLEGQAMWTFCAKLRMQTYVYCERPLGCYGLKCAFGATIC